MNKRKKLIQIIILAAMVLGITGIVRYNYEMYDLDIARVVDADNKEDDSGEEPRYTQKLTLKIKNHEHKGEVYVTENSFFYSQMDTTEYKKGDIVFVYMSEKNGEMSVVVNKLKRDDYAVFLTGLFCFALFVTEEKRGLLILGTLIVQIAVFVYSLQFFLKEEEGQVVVYHEDQKTPYEYTGILIDNLPEEEKQKLKEGFFVKDEKELYSMLENFSS